MNLVQVLMNLVLMNQILMNLVLMNLVLMNLVQVLMNQVLMNLVLMNLVLMNLVLMNLVQVLMNQVLMNLVQVLMNRAVLKSNLSPGSNPIALYCSHCLHRLRSRFLQNHNIKVVQFWFEMIRFTCCSHKHKIIDRFHFGF